MLIIVTINLIILRISIKQLVIFTTFKPYIRIYLQRLNKNIGTQGVHELFFCELKGFGDSRIKAMTCKMFY